MRNLLIKLYFKHKIYGKSFLKLFVMRNTMGLFNNYVTLKIVFFKPYSPTCNAL